MAKPIIYPTDLYLVRDADGFSHWYDADPLRLVDREAAEIDIPQLPFSAYGVGTIHNPLRVRLSCSLVDRVEQFTAMKLVNIRNGSLQMHVEQVDGTTVDIIEGQRSNLPEYPLTGMVLDAQGVALVTRCYSLTGECSDKNKKHQLVLMKNKVSTQVQPDSPQVKISR